MAACDFTSTLLTWYAANRRDLPWRGSRDPYFIWLSEVILQQTRIGQGTGYWLRFVERWPTVDALAAATEDEVLLMWQGLGYYSRARNLLFAARQVVGLGGFPRSVEGLRRLKGVGEYTAAAIASMAFGVDVATVDGNVLRVLARHQGIDTPADTAAGKRLFAALAQSLLPKGKAAEFNQAMMDFGAIQCVPKSPDCGRCPLAGTCRALARHQVGRFPVKAGKTAVKTRSLTYVYVRCGGQTAIRRRPAGDIWQGLWEPLLIEDAPMPHFQGELTLVRHRVRHVLTHRVLLADFYLLEAQMRPDLPGDYVWIDETEIDNYGKPRLVERLLEALADCDKPAKQ